MTTGFYGLDSVTIAPFSTRQIAIPTLQRKTIEDLDVTGVIIGVEWLRLVEEVPSNALVDLHSFEARAPTTVSSIAAGAACAHQHDGGPLPVGKTRRLILDVIFVVLSIRWETCCRLDTLYLKAWTAFDSYFSLLVI